MTQVHMTESEVAEDFGAALEKVRHGIEVIVERESQPVAVLKPPEPVLRKISECIAILDPNSTATIDQEWAADVAAAVEAHREPLEPPDWD